MRISSYTIGSPLADQPFYILMHGFTGAVDKVPYALGNCLIERRGEEYELGDDIFADLSEKDLFQLESRGYLTALTKSEERQVMVQIAATLHEMDILHSPTNFMFVPTYTCNLRCPYCFQSHEMHGGQGYYGAVITQEQVDHAFTIIDRFSRRGAISAALGLIGEPLDSRPLSHPGIIGLFGGEPLSEGTQPIIPYIVEQAARRGSTVSAVTNGVQLDKFVDLIGTGLIDELQITLDGLAELHNTRRIGPQFRNTFDTISKNISMALDRKARVSVRLNIDTTNIRDVQGLSEHFRQLGWSNDPNFSVHAAVVSQGATQLDANSNFASKSPLPKPYHKPLVSQAELVELTSNLQKTANSCVRSYETWAQETLKACLSGDDYPFKRVAHCSAESGLLMFDPLGDVYSCWEEVGQREHRIATYDENGIQFISAMATQWLSRFPGAIEQCSECPYALIHTSGCGKHARTTSGNIFEAACESFQEYFPQTLANVYENLETALFSLKEKDSELEEMSSQCV